MLLRKFNPAAGTVLEGMLPLRRFLKFLKLLCKSGYEALRKRLEVSRLPCSQFTRTPCCPTQEFTHTSPEKGQWFTTTHWSVVLAAGLSDSPRTEEALERLCQTYWYPLYAYVRRQGHDDETAKDFTQSFFARFLEKNYIAQVQRERGKFRSFLLASLKHFLSDEWDKARAQKRGGGQKVLSLDDTTGEGRYRLEPVDTMDAEKLFERRWALTVLDQARHRLKEEFFQGGKSELYERLKVFESGDRNGPPVRASGRRFRIHLKAG